MEFNKSEQAYNLIKANRYDKESRVIRGNRESHRIILSDFLTYLKQDQKVFVDLGCGTGDLTTIFFDLYPEIEGILVDGSADMLAKAQERFKELKNKINFKCISLEELKWSELEKKPDFVFSSFAIHHLADNQKWQLYLDIFENLNPGGIFILFDYFKPQDERSDKLLEFMACMDIKRRALSEMKRQVDIQEVIKNDRAAKEAEGDQEGSLKDHFEKLSEIGFKSLTLVFKEARLAGLVAFKD